MAKRTKKPPVKPERRQSWMKRHERGESISDIAVNDQFDARTVRRHIEQAKQEREIKEARSIVLRNALERHYGDLCDYAEKLIAQASGQKALESPRDEYMQNALRQHLPRSPIWGYLKQRDSLQERIDQFMQEAGMEIEKVVRSDSRLSAGLDASEIGVVPGITIALKFQIEHWAQGGQGLNIEDSLISEPAEEGFVNLRYGFSQMGKVNEEHITLIGEVLLDWESRIRHWEEFEKLKKSFTELRRVEKNLTQELTVITLRRIVPGRCRYCPL